MGVQFTVTIDILSCRRSLKFTCFCACVGVEPRWNGLEQAVLGALCRAGRQSHLSGAHNLDDDIPKEYTHALLQKPTLPACCKALTYQSTNDENNISWSNISFQLSTTSSPPPALKISWGPPTANLWPDWSPQKRVNRDKLDQR